MIVYAEGTPATGAGHLIRCASLAQALGATLVTRAIPDSLHAWAWAGQRTEVLDAASPDAAVALLVQRDAGPVVVDHPAVSKIDGLVLIEDVPGRDVRAARLVINPWADPVDYPGTPTCTGPAFALVRPEFAAGEDGPRDGRTVVMLGATDHLGLRPGLVADLRRLGREPLPLGHPPLGPHELSIALRGSAAGVVSCSGIAIEADVCGLPLVAIETAANQSRLAALLRQAGVPVFLPGDQRIVTATPVRPGIFDGRGAQRVAERIRETVVDSGLCLATWADSPRLLAWANDPLVRGASFSTDAITDETHARWLRMILQDPERRLFISASGSVRLARQGSDATISIVVDPDCRGRGEGRRLLGQVQDWAARSTFCRRLIAWIRLDNPSSLRLFAGCGYVPAGDELQSGHPARRFILELP